MNDPVDRVLLEREAMERGFRGGMVLSVLGHLLVVGASIAAPLLLPKRPVLQVAEGFAVALPPGGGGTPSAEPPPPDPTTAEPARPEPPKAEPPPKILKPPKEAPKKGLPELDARKRKGKAEKPPPSRAVAGTGRSTAFPGLDIGLPAGPGVPYGADPFGDWYLGSVTQKIWLLWNQQIRTSMTQQVTVAFTILADGSVTDIRVVQSSGVFLLDQAAQRAVATAAPFAPLPKDYGTNRLTIQAIFKPSP